MSTQQKSEFTPYLKMVEEAGEAHFEALVQAPARALSSLPESIFVQVFLPFFCGEKSILDSPKIMPDWISIAGSPSKEVQIVDDDMKPLFKIPAMADTSTIDVTALMTGKQNFMDIVKTFMLYRNQIPARAENYLNDVIEPRIASLRTDSKVFNENEKRWQEIFIRYGKAPSEKAKEKDLEKAKGNMLPDELDFDDKF